MDQPTVTRPDNARSLPVGRVEFGLGANSNEVARVVTAYFLGMSVAPLLLGAIADR